MENKKAIEWLIKQQRKIESLQCQNSSAQEFKDWKAETTAIIKNIYGEDSSCCKKFCTIIYSQRPKSEYWEKTQDNRVSGNSYLKGLSQVEALIKGMIMDIGLSEEKTNATTNAIEIVKNICNKFHSVAQQIEKRHDKRSTIDIVDEYDVQDLLHALLKLHFDDVRAEEYTPSYAASASRMDFLLKQEKIVIEVKKTRKGLAQKEIGEQLIIDIERYKTHPNCKNLICFVYDPEKRIVNPAGIENDLTGKRKSLEVFVLIIPKS